MAHLSLSLGLGIPPSLPLLAGATSVYLAISNYRLATRNFGDHDNFVQKVAIFALQTIGWLSTIGFSALAVLHTISLFEAVLPYTITTLAPWTLGMLITSVALRALFTELLNRNTPGGSQRINYDLMACKGMAMLGLAAWIFSELN